MWTILWPIVVTLNIQVRGSEVSEKEIKVNGRGFLGLLTLLFIGLKLTGHIAWSWWWVLSPLWVPFVFVFVVVVFTGVVISYAFKKGIK